MAFPRGVELCEVMMGRPVDSAGRGGLEGRFTLTASIETAVWRLGERPVRVIGLPVPVSVAAGDELRLLLPVPGQVGWTDDDGVPVASWDYRLTGAWFRPAGGSVAVAKTFRPRPGDRVMDLDCVF